MNPEDFNFYRLDVASEYVPGATPSFMTYARAKAFLKDFQIRAAMRGDKVRTRFGIYWAEKKP